MMENIIAVKKHNFLFGGPIKNHVNSFCEVIDYWASTHETKLAIQFLKKGGEAESVTFSELRDRSLAIAQRLSSISSPGQCAILMFEQGIDYLCSFLGCLYAGVIAVTAFPPHEQRRNERLESIINDCAARIILVNDLTQEIIEKDSVIAGKDIVLLNVSTANADNLPHHPLPLAELDTLAFLQYTSGSTSSPKGVMITHGNLLHNLEMLRSGMGHHNRSVFVSWLPLYHDMGLIFAALSAMFNGCPLYLMPPDDFVRQPKLWLDAISKYGGTVTGAPDFAYRLCVDRISEPPAALDLSSLETMLSGSEPIRYSTVERFFNHFQSVGIKRSAMRAGYGLAESTVYVSCCEIFSQSKRFDLQYLEEGVAVEVESGGRMLVCCGDITAEYAPQIKIVNTRNFQPLPDSSIGEVWINSQSNGAGYWGRSQESEQTFRAVIGENSSHFMRTGDLGFIKDGRFFVCGRVKDIIIIRGRNIYPADVCSAVEQAHELLRSRPMSAFSIALEDEEALVVAIATKLSDEVFNEIAEVIKTKVLQEFGVLISGIIVVNNQNLHRTTSGKIQHIRIKDEFIGGELPIVKAFYAENLRCHLQALEQDRGLASTTAIQTTQLGNVEQVVVDWVCLLTKTQAPVDLEKNLFQLGLDSLNSARLMEMIAAYYGVNITLAEVSVLPTLKNLVAKIELQLASKFGLQHQGTDIMVEVIL